MAERSKQVRPFGDGGPLGRTVDRETLRDEFYSNVIVDSDTEERKIRRRLR
jgi:hypothetical protein